MRYSKYLFLMACVAILLASCNSSENNEISAHGNKVHPNTLQLRIDSLAAIHEVKGNKDPNNATKLLNSYVQYFTKFQNDDKSATYMIKSGDIAVSLGKWEKAAEIYQRFFNKYQTHPLRDDILFEIGFIYDLQLNEKPKAEQSYSLYLKTFPDSLHVDQVKARMRDLYLTEKELIEKFNKLNK